jgi:hypothetical protein
MVKDESPIVKTKEAVRNLQIISGETGELFDVAAQIVTQVPNGSREKGDGLQRPPDPEAFKERAQGVKGVRSKGDRMAIFSNLDLLPPCPEREKGISAEKGKATELKAVHSAFQQEARGSLPD